MRRKITINEEDKISFDKDVEGQIANLAQNPHGNLDVAGGYVGAHAVTQVLAGRRKADRWGTALATLGGNMAGEWVAGKMVRHPQNAPNWMKW